MKYIDEFREDEIGIKLARELQKRNSTKVNIMEVCGTHTMSIFRNGIRGILPSNINLISGPGCPVCVTPQGYIDTAIEISKRENVIITTFGDLIRIPGKNGSLSKARASGGDIRTVYSPMDAIKIAKENSSKEVVFLAVGFETTTPIIALSILEAKEYGINNISFLISNKKVPEALNELVKDKDLEINGFILPGHVSVIIGEEPYNFLGEKYKIPAVITGFEPIDILKSLITIMDLIENKNPKIVNEYKRAVKDGGNKIALNCINEVFKPCVMNWRGLGNIENSGYEIKEEYEEFDALKRFNIKMNEYLGNPNCKCGEILTGKLTPKECPLFKKACTPENPIGSCMVSSEGTCAAYYKYFIDEV